MTTVAYLLAIVLAVGGGEAPPILPAELVPQLGSDDFKDREAASAALANLGAAALPAVEAGARSSDAEIAQRCRALLPTLRKLQLLEQVEAVRSGKADIKLPLLAVYRARVGADREPFEVYAAALVADPELLVNSEVAIASGDAKSLSQLIEKRAAGLVAEFGSISTPAGMDQQRLSSEFPDRVAAVLLAAALVQAPVDDAMWNSFTRVLLTSLAFRARIKGSDARGESLRKLLEQWCLTAQSEQAITRALRQMLLYERRDAASVLARRVLDGKARENAVLRGTAVDALGRYGNINDDLSRILPLLDDQTEVWPGNLVYLGREVGDVAVLAAVRITGQRPQDYGISEAAIELSIGAVFVPGGKLAQALRCPIPGFDSDEARRSAQSKLRQWLVENTDVDKGLLLATPRANPAQFVAQARREAQESVFYGRRWQLWTNGGSNGDGFQATIDQGKITLVGKLFDPGDVGAQLGGTYDTLLGRAFVVRTLGRPTSVAISAIDFASEDRVVATVVECRSTISLRFERKEVTGKTTTEVVYDQRDDGVSLKVKRTRNRGGSVELDEAVAAKDLIELRTSSPAIVAVGLEPLLLQLQVKLPPQK